MGCYGHKLSNGVLFAHLLILGVPGGSSHLAYRRRVPPGHNPPTRVKYGKYGTRKYGIYISTKYYVSKYVSRKYVSEHVSRISISPLL